MRRLGSVALTLLVAAGGTSMNADAQPIVRVPSATGLPFSEAVVADGLIFVAGAMGTGENPMQVSGDIATQTRRTLENIDRTLKAQGSSLERAVSMMVYLKNAADFAAMNEVYKTFFPKDPPARTTIVADLVLPEGLVEMSAVALPPGAPREVVHPAAWQKSPNPYSYGVKTGDTLFLAGLVARDVRSNAPVSGDIGAQTKLVLENAGEILRAAGMSYDDVVSARVFITNGGEFQGMNSAYRPFFGGRKPARATVVTGLMSPAYKVEITLVAVKGAREALVTPNADGSPGAPSPNFSSAIKIGRRLYVAGTLGDTDANKGNMRAETRETLARIQRTLKLAGCDASCIVDAVAYITDVSKFGEMNEVWREVFGSNLPARATVKTGLVGESGLIEVMVTAVR